MTARRRILALAWLVLAACLVSPLAAKDGANHVDARLLSEGRAAPGHPLTLAIVFRPEPGWHGYWLNPGDAGYPMQLEWDLPEGWSAGPPQYPVPRTLVIGGLMNHVYEGPYAVLVDLRIPASADLAQPVTIGLDAQWLACTDEICVPEQARMSVPVGAGGAISAPPGAFERWHAAIPALLDSRASFETRRGSLRVGIPLPADLAVGDAHLFVAQRDLVDYAAVQTFSRDGDLLVAEIPLADAARTPREMTGILALGDGNGVRFAASPGKVPTNGIPLRKLAGGAEGASLVLLLLGALAGGLLLNVMPCVFPILSLKALSLARAGESDARARSEGLAYTAGVMLATLALGALLLLLRSAGENVGWAFQLQEPAVVVVLLVLATAISANFAGLFELPSLSLTRGGEPAGAFATGLLAAFVATPCTGPFMAAAMGAALLLPWEQALLLFAALGLGLALPFLLLGFVPRLRTMLPRPGKWMDTFRKVMAIPMALTALALVWLCWRLGGPWFASMALAIAAVVVGSVVWAMDERQAGRKYAYILVLGVSLAAVLGSQILPRFYRPAMSASADSLLAAEPFTEARLAAARAAGKPVFVWFTADWCLTCKVNERVAIEREATRDAFAKAGVVALVGDWTRRDPAITRFLTRQGAAGVPLYMWYPPGGDGQQLPQVLSPDGLVTLAQSMRPVAPPRATPPAPPAGDSARSARPAAGSD
jgi:DsbC/DsbD-like thiol-disulfide interchange protein/cytochrome c biogenesis protein CcdA